MSEPMVHLLPCLWIGPKEEEAASREGKSRRRSKAVAASPGRSGRRLELQLGSVRESAPKVGRATPRTGVHLKGNGQAGTEMLEQGIGAFSIHRPKGFPCSKPIQKLQVFRFSSTQMFSLLGGGGGRCG